MYKLVFLFLTLLQATPIFSQVKILPDACTLITSPDINALFSTIVKQQEMNAPNNAVCTFRSDDNAVEVMISQRALKDHETAAAFLKHDVDSITMDIANAQPEITYTTIAALEGAGAGTNYMTGIDPLMGPIVRLQFVLDKFLVTFDTKGIPVKTVIEHLPEIYKIISRNSGL